MPDTQAKPKPTCGSQKTQHGMDGHRDAMGGDCGQGLWNNSERKGHLTLEDTGLVLFQSWQEVW